MKWQMKKKQNFAALKPERKAVMQEAIKDFQKAMEFSKEKGELYNRIGLSYYYLKDYEKAIDNYDKCNLAGTITTPTFIHNTGMTYAKWGKLEKAKSRFEQLQKLLPKEGLVFRNWTVYNALSGDIPKALDNLEKAIELGYQDIEFIKSDDSLESIRQEPRYQAIIQKLQKN